MSYTESNPKILLPSTPAAHAKHLQQQNTGPHDPKLWGEGRRNSQCAGLCSYKKDSK